MNIKVNTFCTNLLILPDSDVTLIFLKQNSYFFSGVKKVSLFFFFLIDFWLHWVFVAARGLSLAAVSRGYSLLQCAGFLLL